jgi:DNA repair exonuclease SbcCD ATPase subunit
MSKEVRIVEAQTMKSLEDEIKAEEAALKAATSEDSPAGEPAEQVPVVDETPVTAPTPTVEPTSTPAPTPAATPAPTPDALRTAMAEKDAKIAELTKRIMDADGRRGGELSELRRQNEALSTKLEALMAKLEKVQPPNATPAPVEPEVEPLAEYDAAVKDGIRQLARREMKPIADALEQTKAELAAAKTEIAEAAKGSYETAFRIMEEKIEQAVPKYREYNVDPKFIAWLEQNFYTEVLNDAATKLNLERATTIFRKYDAEQKTSPATETPVTQRGPVKPSKEAQVAVPAASASPPATPSPTVNIRARVAELEKKMFSHRITPKESKELDDLYLQQAKSS